MILLVRKNYPPQYVSGGFPGKQRPLPPRMQKPSEILTAPSERTHQRNVCISVCKLSVLYILYYQMLFVLTIMIIIIIILDYVLYMM